MFFSCDYFILIVNYYYIKLFLLLLILLLIIFKLIILKIIINLKIFIFNNVKLDTTLHL